ncbi:MAG: zinc transporter ZupT [Cyanobium sp.]
MDPGFLFAFLLTLAAGLSTGIGSVIGLLSRGFHPRLLSLSLSFSAGVMLFVSFVEIFPKARQSLEAVLGGRLGYGAALLAFFAGIGVIALIDRLLPEHHLLPVAPFQAASEEAGPLDSRVRPSAALMRTGLFTALAIAIHNFPEGLATFVGAIAHPRLGLSIALAIAIHNIPEGLAISAPVYFATRSRRLAFLLSFASGLAEPIGAVVGYLLLRQVFNDVVFGLVFASVAGIMVYICFDELLPTARQHGAHGLMMVGVLGGMAVMSLSLLLLV